SVVEGPLLKFTSAFIKIENFGVRRSDDSVWKAGKKRVRDGYKGVRNLYIEDSRVIKLICEINKEPKYLYPIFKCTAFKEEDITFQAPICSVSKLKISNVASAILQELKLTTEKIWPGTNFFGLTSSAYRKFLEGEGKERDSLIAPSSENTEIISSIATEENNMGTTSEKSGFGIDNVKSTKHCKWVGVIDYGDTSSGVKPIAFENLLIHVGFTSQRLVNCKDNNTKLVSCKVIYNEILGAISFQLSTEDGQSFENTKISKAVNTFLMQIECVSTTNWSGFDFYGFRLQQVKTNLKLLKPTRSNSSAKKNETDQKNHSKVLKNVSNILHRNAGPTKDLSKSSYKTARNQAIHSVVDATCFGDIKSYIDYLIENHGDIVFESMIDNKEMSKRLDKSKDMPIRQISVKDSCEILVGKCDLSQREYKALKSLLLRSNVHLASYKDAKDYAYELDVGEIYYLSHWQDKNDCKINCMHASTGVISSLNQVTSTLELFQRFEFIDLGRTAKLVEYLNSKSLKYQNFDKDKRTIFLRDTGDNFRATKNYPTEQISFSIMNMKELLNSPYGQFATSLFRGTEKRETLISHGQAHFNELEELVEKGATLTLPDGNTEHFNVVVFFVADLSYVKEVIGKASCTSTYGCYRCEKPIHLWHAKNLVRANEQSQEQHAQLGKKAFEILGEQPDKDSPKYKEFIRNNLAQWAQPIFTSYIIETMPPCGLHLILAIHRYLWTYLYHIISKRGQEDQITTALRHIQLDYLAYQIECYHKSKKKMYDGSDTLKMIGNDCKIFEMNIDKFLDVFIKKGEKKTSMTYYRLRKISQLYNKFRDIARTIRSVNPSQEEVDQFETKVEDFFQKMKEFCGDDAIKRKPYLHILREHIPPILKLWFSILGWGYGYFHCSAGEHLNKQMKTLERYGTNNKDNRFIKILKKIRLRQFHFSQSVLKNESSITCSRCHEVGHNCKNKSCRLHPDQPMEYHPPTDTEDN
uniref:Uncharacterized protein n=2 Tax=Clytia hemisphaerica TaxID=252671 RepID=A0A7M5WU97_9CNID